MGILSGSGGLAGTIELYASGAVDPRPLVAATVSLEQVAGVLAGGRPAGAGDGPEGPRRPAALTVQAAPGAVATAILGG